MGSKSLSLSILALLTVLPASALAQPADLPITPATTGTYPPGVAVKPLQGGPVYVDGRGLTLYGMDMRTLLRWAPDPALYCRDACADTWEPLLAPAGTPVNIRYPQGFRDVPPEGYVAAANAPDWSVIEGAAGPQWVYKGWHLVFTRKGDQPGSTAHDGEASLTWNTLKFVPPRPQIVAPPGVTTRFENGAWALADGDGNLLYSGKCQSDCDSWQPLTGGLASRGLGQWRVSNKGDVPQWFYRGKPVYVSQGPVPGDAQILRP